MTVNEGITRLDLLTLVFVISHKQLVMKKSFDEAINPVAAQPVTLIIAHRRLHRCFRMNFESLLLPSLSGTAELTEAPGDRSTLTFSSPGDLSPFQHGRCRSQIPDFNSALSLILTELSSVQFRQLCLAERVAFKKTPKHTNIDAHRSQDYYRLIN